MGIVCSSRLYCECLRAKRYQGYGFVESRSEEDANYELGIIALHIKLRATGGNKAKTIGPANLNCQWKHYSTFAVGC
uniref:Uncharacterized protein n=1 Tax=Chenopodium quinoa TaxID=63459 RepID=A0A803LJU7_CHEQI